MVEHTSLGYAQFKVATLPSAAAGDEAVSHLPWEPKNLSGGRFVSRNEIDLPVELGPLKITPYLLGELGYWGEDIHGEQLTRAYYQAASAPRCPCGPSIPRRKAASGTCMAWPTRSSSRRNTCTPRPIKAWPVCPCTINWTTTRSKTSAAAS